MSDRETGKEDAVHMTQPILKETDPDYSLEGLMPNLQYFGHLM